MTQEWASRLQVSADKARVDEQAGGSGQLQTQFSCSWLQFPLSGEQEEALPGMCFTPDYQQRVVSCGQ